MASEQMCRLIAIIAVGIAVTGCQTATQKAPPENTPAAALAKVRGGSLPNDWRDQAKREVGLWLDDEFVTTATRSVTLDTPGGAIVCATATGMSGRKPFHGHFVVMFGDDGKIAGWSETEMQAAQFRKQWQHDLAQAITNDCIRVWH